MRPTRGSGWLEHARLRSHLVGSAMALFGVALALLDPVGLPGAVLIFGFYALGFAAGRAWESRPAAFDPVPIDRALEDDIARVADSLPPEILGRLSRIHDIVRVQVLPGLEALPLGSLDRFLVEQTVSDYLPSAVGQYRLAAGNRVDAAGLSSSTCAEQVLDDQLCLIESDMRRVAGVIQQVALDRMLAHRRFLNQRLGQLDGSG